MSGESNSEKDADAIAELVLSSTSEEIARAIVSIQESLETIASSTNYDIFSWIVPAIAGAFSAYVFNLLHWLMVQKKLEKSKLIYALIEMIEKIEDYSIKYWLSCSDQLSEIESKQLEISIKSALSVMRKNNNLFIDKYYIKIIKNEKSNNVVSKLESFGSEIYDLITGGEFESLDRSKSTTRAVQIGTKCSEIRAFLLNLDYS